MGINIFTIGFTGKSAPTFFGLLRSSGVKTLFDVRLNNTSQLAGFSKKSDLPFFLRELCNIEYVELPELAPESDDLKKYRSKQLSWESYEDRYKNLLSRRNAERILMPDSADGGCLLCSEHLPHFCHRRVAAEYLREKFGCDVKVKHLIK